MRRADKSRWAAAHTLADLGELTAQWLEGTLAGHPYCCDNDGPDPETADLVPVLARANRGGYVTDCSQPGIPIGPGWDGSECAQRAAVSGFAYQALADRLECEAIAADLVVIRHNTATRWRTSYANTFAVSHSGYHPDGAPIATCAFGARVSRSAIRFMFDGCAPDAVARLCAAQQVEIIDPEWGRNDRLWPVLDRAFRPVP